MADVPVGYYVHHHGTGHMRRALQIIRQLHCPVILFSSLPRPEDCPPQVTYIQLPSDVVKDYTQPDGAVFHYTPYSPLIFVRNQIMVDAWKTYGITNMYVDVSVEVAVLAKLYGLTVGHGIMHGIRTDPAHTLLYNAADYLLAHFSQAFDTLSNRSSSGSDVNGKTRYSGGISRFAKRLPRPIGFANGSPSQVVVSLSPASNQSMADGLITSAAAWPDITWHLVGSTLPASGPLPGNLVVHGVIDDPEQLYLSADLIIGAGGNNTIMEVASLAKPFICIPEPRPYNEQIAAAKALERLNAAVCLPQWPEAQDWPAVFNQLRTIDIRAFNDLIEDDAAGRAAAIIESAGISDR